MVFEEMCAPGRRGVPTRDIRGSREGTKALLVIEVQFFFFIFIVSRLKAFVIIEVVSEVIDAELKCSATPVFLLREVLPRAKDLIFHCRLRMRGLGITQRLGESVSYI